MGRGVTTKRRSGAIEAKTYPYWFAAPATVIFTAFFVLPAALGLWLSFTNASTLSSRQDFIGMDNFALLFGANGEAFLAALGNQFGYALLTTIGKTGLGVLLAFFLNRAFLGRNVLRAIVYMPIMFSTIVVGIVFGFILAHDGLLNSFLRSIGLGFLTQDWLGDFDLALFSVSAIDIWMGVGWTVVLVLAALQAVPAELLESAEVDGAGRFQRAIHVSLPVVAPTIGLAALLTLISGLKAFEIIYATTGGGPGHATEVMTTFLAKALGTTNLGYASAVSFVQFAVITVIALAINLINRRIEARMS